MPSMLELLLPQLAAARNPIENILSNPNTPGIIPGPIGNPAQTPGIAPPIAPQAESGNRLQNFASSFSEKLNNPLSQFGLNLLAESGPSLTPQSPLSSIGRAGIRTAQQTQANDFAEIQKRLLESQISKNTSIAKTGGNPTAGNVQSTFKGANGNMFIVSRNGEVKDTGIEFNNNVEIVEQADGSAVAVNRADGTVIGTVITPDQAADATVRKSQTAANIELPKALADLDSTTRAVDKTIDTVSETIGQVSPATTGLRGALTGGIPGTEAKALRSQIKTIQANLGFDRLQKMREASKSGGALGQVSERELDLLVSSVEALDPELDDVTLKKNLEDVVRHYENYKREIEIMKNVLREQAGQPAVEDDEFAGFSIAN